MKKLFAVLASLCLLLSAFGAGLSWGSAIMSMRDCNVSPVIEY